MNFVDKKHQAMNKHAERMKQQSKNSTDGHFRVKQEARSIHHEQLLNSVSQNFSPNETGKVQRKDNINTIPEDMLFAVSDELLPIKQENVGFGEAQSHARTYNKMPGGQDSRVLSRTNSLPENSVMQNKNGNASINHQMNGWLLSCK